MKILVTGDVVILASIWWKSFQKRTQAKLWTLTEGLKTRLQCGNLGRDISDREFIFEAVSIWMPLSTLHGVSLMTPWSYLTSMSGIREFT